MAEGIAILGWGSLLWDERPDFDWFHEQHGKWNFDGPEIPLEFSRISMSRGGALTLVVDPANGKLCRVAYALSKRRDTDDAICDLRTREGTIRSQIGTLYTSHAPVQGELAECAAIREWARAKNLVAVVWTALRSNFQEKVQRPFSVTRAVEYVGTLPR